MKDRLAWTLCALVFFFNFARADSIYDASSPSTQDGLDQINRFLIRGDTLGAASRALALVETVDVIQHPLDVAAVRVELGDIAHSRNQYLIADSFYADAIDIFKQQNASLPLADTMVKRAYNNIVLGSPEEALELLAAAKTLYEKLDNPLGLANLSIYTSRARRLLGHYTDAQQELNRALSLAKSSADNTLSQEAHLQMAALFLDIKDYQQAKKHLKLALVLDEETHSALRKAHCYVVMSDINLAENKVEAAKQKLHLAFEAFSSLQKPLSDFGLAAPFTSAPVHPTEHDDANDEEKRIYVHLGLSEALYLLKDFQRSLQHAEAGYNLSAATEQPGQQLLALNLIIQTHLAKNDYSNAFATLQSRSQLMNTMLDKEQITKMASLQSEIALASKAQAFQLEAKNKNEELNAVKQQNMQNMLMLGSLVSLLLFIFLLWSRYNHYRQTRRLATEVKMRTQELEIKNHQLEEANDALQQASMRDPLTGLYNRYYLSAQLPAEIKRSQHHFDQIVDEQYPENQDLLCFLIDIDFFKDINDTYGHLAGDKFLKEFTATLREIFRETDLLIRWGGEEFLVICRHGNREELVELAERLRSTISQTRFQILEDRFINATCSIGFCALPLCRKNPFEFSWSKTFAFMDYCLYAAKLSGRNCWVGALEGCNDRPGNPVTRTVEKKFEMSRVDIRTSLNNLASIEWPAD